jgi:hypothetical protein
MLHVQACVFKKRMCAGRLEAHGHAYSFMTRKLAPLAPDLVALLTHCGQAVDPNLVKLKEAYTIIERKLQDSNKSRNNDTDVNDCSEEHPTSHSLEEPTSGSSPTSHACASNAKREKTGGLGDVTDAEVHKDMLVAATSRSDCSERRSWKECIDRKQGDIPAARRVGKHAQANAAHVSPEGGPEHVQQRTWRKKMKSPNASRCSVETADVMCKEQARAMERQHFLSKAAQENENSVAAPEKRKKRRRSRAEKRAAADAGSSRKKSKQGILGAPKTAELAGLAYDSGQDSD